jgi:hypothetical protein
MLKVLYRYGVHIDRARPILRAETAGGGKLESFPVCFDRL